MDFNCYGTLAQLRKKDSITDPTKTADDPRLLSKLRAATAAIIQYCGERIFHPLLETRSFDWESNEYLSFRAFDLLTLTSIVDGTNNTKLTAALIMQGNRFSDATKFGPWYAVRLDVTKDFFLYNVTPFRCMQVAGVWGYHDDYGISGANAWAPVYTDATLATALAPSGNVTSSQRVITLNADPTACYDTEFQTPGISAGALIQLDSEWMQVLTTTASGTSMTVVRGVNGSTAAAHTSASAVLVYQPIRTINEACLRLAQWLVKQDDAPFGKVLTPSLGQVTIPYKFPPDVEELLTPFVKARVE